METLRNESSGFPPTGLTISICTRDRAEDLKRCLISIGRASAPACLKTVEILVIDDGKTPDLVIEEVRALMEARGFSFRYKKKDRDPGLFHSRLIALTLAKSDLILFLDDDVEI